MVQAKNCFYVAMLIGLCGVSFAADVTPATPAAAGHGHDHDAKDHAPKVDAGKVWAELLEGNARFVAGKHQVREVVEKRKELAKGQHPKVIVLTCADSRLSPELIFDQNIGDLFVVRTAGNIGDKIVIGSIEYAAEHLHSCVLLVLGHEKCGAVAAAASGDKMPSDNLKQIVKEIEPAVKEAKRNGANTKEEVLEKAIEGNVSLSAEHILKQSPILEEAVKKGHLKIVKAVYKLESGQVVELKNEAVKSEKKETSKKKETK